MSSMEYERTNEANGFLDRFFKLTQHGTSVKTEFFAGITMFIASVYILAVVPNLLSVSGMPHASAVAAVVFRQRLQRSSRKFLGLPSNENPQRFPIYRRTCSSMHRRYSLCRAMY